MTNDEMFQAFERLRNADVGHVSVDNFERLRSEMRDGDDESTRHRSWHGPHLLQILWRSCSRTGQNYLGEQSSRSHGFSLGVRHDEIYTEWKMLEDDDFWAAVHHA